ncbi:GNAT family N-acetyltransferase [Parasedimentitalea psychrophila]|uniref:GNAT family N-acetyltransferase n=1 Tax=Parasedimentitalea psychrophila TaxID=2997337 RepID=A0A9Y2P2D8_9RHOB|nr:GNAT family N-acetyltransferase [Parasedimentitalea psychrophila]WIY24977.1 GNAT family N-acetyltransferase [Parasedimentitalea psychrophila]
MSAALHLAKPDDLNKVLALVEAFHQEMGIASTEDSRRAAIEPLLNGIPYGAVYLAGPTRAPIGYTVVTFSWSVEFGGMDGSIDELYVRPAVRRRGIATEVLITLPKTLAEAGIKALHLDVDREDQSAQRLYARTRFKPQDRYMLMTKEL